MVKKKEARKSFRLTQKNLQNKFSANRMKILGGSAILFIVFAWLLPSSGLFSTFLLNPAAPFTGKIGFVGMSVEDEIKTYSMRDVLDVNFDGVPDFTADDYDKFPTTNTRINTDGGVLTENFVGLVGAPTYKPNTIWNFDTITHIDNGAIGEQRIIEDPLTPSSWTLADGFYTETYRYATNIRVRVHANMAPWSIYGLTFVDSQSVVYESYTIGEYSPMYEAYSNIRIDIVGVNSTIIETGSDMKANGPISVRFYDWSETPTWVWDDGYSASELTTKINEIVTANGAVRINNAILQTGFDISQGFNILDSTVDVNSQYDFNVGFNLLALTGYYYSQYFGYYHRMEIFDMEIVIPVTFQVVSIFDLPQEQLDVWLELHPELLLPGGVVRTTGSNLLTITNTTVTTNELVTTIQGLPGFTNIEEFVGSVYAPVVMVAIIAVGAAFIFTRRR